MKKILFVALLLSLSLTGFSQFKFKGIGAGLAIGSVAGISSSGGDAVGFGLYVNGLAQILDYVDAEVDFTYYYPSAESRFTKDMYMLNANGHYNFYQHTKLTAYGLAGLNYSHTKSTWEVPASLYTYFGDITPKIATIFTESSSEIGLNVGAGCAYELSAKFDANAQIGYTMGNADQFFIKAGLMYKF